MGTEDIKTSSSAGAAALAKSASSDADQTVVARVLNPHFPDQPRGCVVIR